jgi:hypothetical protein
MQNIIKKLRNIEPLIFFDKKQKIFVLFQINKKEKYFCWERWVSKNRITGYINWNYYLSLKDVVNCIKNLQIGKI